MKRAFLSKLFSTSKNTKAIDFFDKVKRISLLTDQIEKNKNSLDELEYDLVYKNKDEMYISLTDFLRLVDNPKISIRDITNACKHVSEINKNDFSVISIYSIVEDDHLVLCPDISKCETHKDYAGEKINITTVRVGS